MSNPKNILLSEPSGTAWDKLKGRKILIAFSGGKDSLALLAYMAEHRATCNWQLVACHINHNLRGAESLRDEEFCRSTCEKLNIEYISADVDVYSTELYKQRGLEHAARTLRYQILESEAFKRGIDYAVTAHTADDLLESFFVDLLTGASVFTLGGISETKGLFVRPMLDISTTMIEHYLSVKGLNPVYDSSNSDKSYVRNFVRTEVMPVFQGRFNELESTVRRIQNESRSLDSYFDKITNGFTVNLFSGGILLKRELLNSAEEAVKRYIIGKWVSTLARGGKAHTEAILNQMKRNRSVRIDLPNSWLCEVSPRSVRLFSGDQVEPFEFTPNGPVDIYNKQIILPEELYGKVTVRSRRNGDRYNGKKLKDLYERLKLDPYERDRAVLVVKEGQIIWAEHLSPQNEIKVVDR